MIHGASVTLTNEGTNAQLVTKAGSDGGYVFSPVRIGSYTLSVSYAGFQTTQQKNVKVDVGAAVVVNFSLKAGQVTETIEVTTTTPVLERLRKRLSARSWTHAT